LVRSATYGPPYRPYRPILLDEPFPLGLAPGPPLRVPPLPVGPQSVVLLPGRQLVLSVPPAPRPLMPEPLPVPEAPLLLPGLVGPLPVPPRVPVLPFPRVLPLLPPVPPPVLPPLPPLDWATALPAMEIIADATGRASANCPHSARNRRRAVCASILSIKPLLWMCTPVILAARP
jgi:hypothetical protein